MKNRKVISADLPLPPSEHHKLHHRKHQHADPSSGETTKLSDSLRLLAATLYANLGGNASVKEVGEGKLQISTPQGESFQLQIEKNGRVTLSGSTAAPNLTQFLGEIEEDPIQGIIEAAENATTLIQTALERKPPPTPISFEGAGNSQELDQSEIDQSQLIPPTGGEPPDESSPLEPPPVLPQTPPPIQPPLDQPQLQSPNPQGIPLAPQLPPGFPPTASKRITAELDYVATELQQKGYQVLAKRIDQISNSIEKRVSENSALTETWVRKGQKHTIKWIPVIGTNEFKLLLDGEGSPFRGVSRDRKGWEKVLRENGFNKAMGKISSSENFKKPFQVRYGGSAGSYYVVDSNERMVSGDYPTRELAEEAAHMSREKQIQFQAQYGTVQ